MIGNREDWIEFEPGLWRQEHEDGSWKSEFGIISLSPGINFDDYFEKRKREELKGPDVIVDYGTFRSRWTIAELELLFQAKKNYWQVEDYINLAVAQNSVNLTGITAQAARDLFVSLKILTLDRANTIFT